MKRVLVLALAAVSALSFAQVEQFWTPFGITADQEVGGSTGTGSGSALLDVNLDTFALTGTIDVMGLPWSNVTGFHIHSGAFGTNGPVILDLESNGTPSGEDPWSFAVNATINSTILDLMRASETYINIHTAANPAGELRGQLELVPEPATLAALAFGGLALLRRRRPA